MIRKILVLSFVLAMFLAMSGCQQAVTHERHRTETTETTESEEVVIE